MRKTYAFSPEGISDNIYMIVMGDNPVSLAHKKRSLYSWHRNGLKPKIFEATTPLYMDQGYCKELQFDEKTSKGSRHFKNTVFTPTEKSVWCSHYRLWQKCANANLPLIVIEHDIKLKKSIDFSFLEEDIDNNIVPLCETSVRGKKGTFILPGGAYFLTPPMAKKLIVAALRKSQGKGITNNSDHPINVRCLNIRSDSREEKFRYVCCEQNIDRGLGVTVDHGKGRPFNDEVFDAVLLT